MPYYVGSNSDVSTLFHKRGNTSILVGCNPDQSNLDPKGGIFWEPGKGGHALSIGMTRSGKGWQIIAALLQYLGNTITIDPKGENAWITAPRRREIGHRVVILDPFNEVNRRYGSKVGVREVSTRFNPLSVINPNSPDFAEDVMMLAEAVIINTGGDQHWSESAQQLVTGLMAATIEQAPPGQASFRHVRKLLTSPDAELSKAVELLHQKNPNSLGGRLLRRFLPKVDADGKTKISGEIGSIRSTADTQTFMFESERLVSAMESGDAHLTRAQITDSLLATMETDPAAFDLRELATGRVSLYLVLPVDRLQTYGRWLRMILTLAIRAITRQETPPDPPVLFLLDELGTINPGGGLRMIEQAYGLMAGMGIRIWGFLQDLKQLQNDYPNSWETFISNSEMIQVLKVNDNTTADYFSRFLGIRKDLEDSGKGYWTGTGNEVPVLRPDQIRGLGPLESLVLFSGGNFFRMMKVNYFADARFRGMYRPNPLFAAKPASPPPQAKPQPAAAPAAPPPPPKPNPILSAFAGRAAAQKITDWAASDSRVKTEAAVKAAAVDAVGKAAGWWKARSDARAAAAATAAREREEAAQAETRRANEAAALDQRARYAAMLRDAK